MTNEKGLPWHLILVSCFFDDEILLNLMARAFFF